MYFKANNLKKCHRLLERFRRINETRFKKKKSSKAFHWRYTYFDYRPDIEVIVVNKMSSCQSSTRETTLPIICKQITPYSLSVSLCQHLSVWKRYLHYAWSRGFVWRCANSAVILPHDRFLSRLSLLAPPKSPYFHTLTVISIAFRRLSG